MVEKVFLEIIFVFLMARQKSKNASDSGSGKLNVKNNC